MWIEKEMIFKELNISLFNSVNSFAKENPVIDQLAIFLAEDLNTVFISFLVFLLVTQWKIYNLDPRQNNGHIVPLKIT